MSLFELKKIIRLTLSLLTDLLTNIMKTNEYYG